MAMSNTIESAGLDLPKALAAVASEARASKLFGAVTIDGECLSCAAPSSAAPAFYEVRPEGTQLWVALVTEDRYLSQSIEQDLIHSGDKLGDLLSDELIDVEHPNPIAPKVEHFRDAKKRFTFRSAVPAADLAAGPAEAARRLWLTLRAYEACFSPLGGMREAAGDD